MMNELKLLPREGLQRLLQQLTLAGYRPVGPQVEQETLLYRAIESADQLPWGFRDLQQPGSYRLQQGDSKRAFAWANGPQALKPLFFAPQERLWQVEQTPDGLKFNQTLPHQEKLAIIGVRPCDLAALAIQDQHFMTGVECDHHYARRRENTLLIAVNCSHPASTCFCAATGDGPTAQSGFDLLLDEIDDGYLISAGSEAGMRLLQELPTVAATQAQQQAVTEQRSQAAQQQRSLPQQNLHGRLMSEVESPHWEAIAERCLACGNCTAVCPTCFCHSEHEVPSLSGEHSEHLRQWDSCFTQEHSYIHGIVIRAERAQRYRQWLTHKFDNWHEQFGRSGCVGCGRCISWCPVGIDVTKELSVICGGEA
jgi:ferredoxin